MIDGLFSLINS